MRMPRIRLCALATLGVLAAVALSGCGSSSEPTAAVAFVKSGLLGGFGEQLQHEDDEQEVEELRQEAPQTREEREEAHERLEQATIEAQQAGETSGETSGEAQSGEEDGEAGSSSAAAEGSGGEAS
jgi:hypothetical protein